MRQPSKTRTRIWNKSREVEHLKNKMNICSPFHPDYLSLSVPRFRPQTTRRWNASAPSVLPWSKGWIGLGVLKLRSKPQCKLRPIRGCMVVNNPEKKEAKLLGVGVALGEGTLGLPQLFFLQKSSPSKKRCKSFGRQPERKQPRFHPRALPQHCLSRWKKSTSFDCKQIQPTSTHNWNLPKTTELLYH